MKILFLCLSFKNYRVVIGRKELSALRETTLKTFTKLCPSHLYKFNSQLGTMVFKNGSEILWMHLDDANETTLRGLEVNSVFLDQPEELTEQVYRTLDARIERWDKASPTEETLKSFGYKSIAEWPRDAKTGALSIPSYMLLTPNPDTEMHWIWRLYHVDSIVANNVRLVKADYAYFEVSSVDNPKLPKDNLDNMLANDSAWVNRFVHGKWGISEATIHSLSGAHRIQPTKEWVENFLKKAMLYRVLDHGETAPTCCLWFAAYRGNHICYREYYVAGRTVSYHRARIAELSENETYADNWADPQIFKKTTQKYGGHWSVAEEYIDPMLQEMDPLADSIVFNPADNTELSTRNRINELFMLRDSQINPVTGAGNSPQFYFLDKDETRDVLGVQHVITQVRAQRRLKLTEIDGRPIYSDEREPSVEDHAYDCLRYYVAMHASMGMDAMRVPSPGSFLAIRRLAKAHKLTTNAYGDRKTIG